VELLREHGPVLELGPGRGELLEALRDAGVQARGVDLDEGMAAHARERGLDVATGDGLAALDAEPDGSLGAIVGIQVIEHVARRELGRMLALARAKLRPGGLLVAETVNPHAGHALKTFWVDLTHEHPVFPEVALALAQAAGFGEAFVWFPHGRGDVDADRFVQSSYALVATA
jgi:SAM-dependent methyltransferase